MTFTHSIDKATFLFDVEISIGIKLSVKTKPIMYLGINVAHNEGHKGRVVLEASDFIFLVRLPLDGLAQTLLDGDRRPVQLRKIGGVP